MNEVLSNVEPSPIKSIITNNNEQINESIKIANNFNEYFISVGEKLAGNISRNLDYVEKKSLCDHSIFLYPATENELIEIISQLKNKKAPGIENIKAETLKLISNYITKPLTYVVNKSLEQGYFPTALKTAVVTPIHKSGIKTDVSNYRPITLITSLAKVLEKVV